MEVSGEQLGSDVGVVGIRVDYLRGAGGVQNEVHAEPDPATQLRQNLTRGMADGRWCCRGNQAAQLSAEGKSMQIWRPDQVPLRHQDVQDTVGRRGWQMEGVGDFLGGDAGSPASDFFKDLQARLYGFGLPPRQRQGVITGHVRPISAASGIRSA